MGGGNRIGVEGENFFAVATRSCFRLSSFGRNESGVWRTDGADDGGLKMIWSCCTGAFEYEGRKDGSGLTFRRDRERRYEDSWRLDAALSASRHCEWPEKRVATGLRNNLASIAEEELQRRKLSWSGYFSTMASCLHKTEGQGVAMHKFAQIGIDLMTARLAASDERARNINALIASRGHSTLSSQVTLSVSSKPPSISMSSIPHAL
jgi:hypothetical protein